ncbi:MAG: lysine exporter LysO family protein [Tissierellia bacterium]|nr:lysine exporter LysO family protein [Tissierellia bacterium]
MISIILSIIGGFLVGRYSGIDFIHCSDMIQVGLYILFFFVGLDMGRNKDILRIFRRMGSEAIFIPILIALGSVLGGILSGIVFGYPWNQGAALGSGMGWYSLSGVIIEPYSKELAAIAFLSNIVREVIAIIFVPFIAANIGFFAAVSVPGAGAMDTVLPIISRSTDQKTTIISFFTGSILSFLIPILVQFFISL